MKKLLNYKNLVDKAKENQEFQKTLERDNADSKDQREQLIKILNEKSYPPKKIVSEFSSSDEDGEDDEFTQRVKTQQKERNKTHDREFKNF